MKDLIRLVFTQTKFLKLAPECRVSATPLMCQRRWVAAYIDQHMGQSPFLETGASIYSLIHNPVNITSCDPMVRLKAINGAPGTHLYFKWQVQKEQTMDRSHDRHMFNPTGQTTNICTTL